MGERPGTAGRTGHAPAGRTLAGKTSCPKALAPAIRCAESALEHGAEKRCSNNNLKRSGVRRKAIPF